MRLKAAGAGLSVESIGSTRIAGEDRRVSSSLPWWKRTVRRRRRDLLLSLYAPLFLLLLPLWQLTLSSWATIIHTASLSSLSRLSLDRDIYMFVFYMYCVLEGFPVGRTSTNATFIHPSDPVKLSAAAGLYNHHRRRPFSFQLHYAAPILYVLLSIFYQFFFFFYYWSDQKLSRVFIVLVPPFWRSPHSPVASKAL